jgi:hypothetical protein
MPTGQVYTGSLDFEMDFTKWKVDKKCYNRGGENWYAQLLVPAFRLSFNGVEYWIEREGDVSDGGLLHGIFTGPDCRMMKGAEGYIRFSAVNRETGYSLWVEFPLVRKETAVPSGFSISHLPGAFCSVRVN